MRATLAPTQGGYGCGSQVTTTLLICSEYWENLYLAFPTTTRLKELGEGTRASECALLKRCL